MADVGLAKDPWGLIGQLLSLDHQHTAALALDELFFCAVKRILEKGQEQGGQLSVMFSYILS